MSFKLNYFSNSAKNITIKIINSPLQESKLVLLNPTDKLFTIRQKLEKDYILFKFFSKFSENENNGGSYEFAEIESKIEGQLSLSEIIDKNILYIECIDWNFFIKKCKLDYGCTMTFNKIKKANKKAFSIKNCVLKEIGGEGYEMGEVEFKSTEERMKITNLFFTADINIDKFVKLGMSIGNMKNEKFYSETSGSFHFIKHAKASLEFSKYIEPTPDFIKEVENAIISQDPTERFRQITEEYGQFIPMKVILGGRVHFNEYVTSTGGIAENSKEITVNANAGGVLGAGMSSISNNSEGDTNYCKFNCTRIIGGELPDILGNFNEETWVKSLEKDDCKKWDCIEYQNPINIFQLLSGKLRKQIIMSIGKRIHYSNIEFFKCRIEEFGRPKKFELLYIPENVLNMIQNKDADCNIFATVTDMTELKNDFFTCQVLCSSSCSSLPPCPSSSCSCPPSKPSLLIHCVQNKFKKRECNLKIKWMVVGYYTDFNFTLSDFNVQLKIFENKIASDSYTMINTINFNYDNHVIKFPFCFGMPVLDKLTPSNSSIVIGHHFFNEEENKIGSYIFAYCSKDKRYVKLPNFTFYTLVISDYCTSGTYDIIPFEHQIMKKPYINLNSNVIDSYPKFISLYSREKTNSETVFLKQNHNKIKLIPIDSKLTKYNFECLTFDPYISVNTRPANVSQLRRDKEQNKIDNTRVDHIKIPVVKSSPSIPKLINNNKQVIQQLKLTHGLILNGYNIQPSEQAIVTEKGKMDMSLYNGQPIVYTNINDPVLSVNLLNFNSDENNFIINTLQPSDLCINFPIAEITYNSNLSESFSKYTDNDEQLYKLYGHFFARKTLIGGRLFIKELNLATLAQIDLFKFYIFWAYNSAKHDIEYINNLPISYLPRINTLDGLLLDTPEKISNWLNNLYQNNVFDIISYKNLIPITQFKNNPLTEENFEEKQPGVSNFKEKLSLKEWVENVIYINLVRWIKDFHFLQGIIITKFYKMEVSKKIAASFIKLPIVKSSNKSYLEIIRPTKKVEEFLINNNIFSIKDLSSSPFINIIQPNDSSHNDYNFLIKFEQYEIHINGDHIKSSTEFEQAINNALNNMKPFKALHDVFDEYGHVFPQKIILGRSFKRNITTTYDISNRIDFKSETLESYLDKLNISYLLTRSGNIIENHELLDLMQNLNDDLEIIELDNIISLYEILDKEQQGKINNIITKYKQDNHRIIMSGITDLKDLDNNNTDHYKRINIQPSLEDENYEVIGSIISKKKNSKLEEFLLKFGLYDFNGFSAMIKTLKNTNIKIEECYILWMIIGIPSKLSVLSPRNHDLQVKYESVTLQPNQIKMKAPISLSQEYIISVNAHHSYETINIRVVEWSENCIRFQINGSTCNNSNINFNIDNIDDSNSFIMSDNDSDTQQELENNFSTIIETVVNNIDCNICILRSDYKTFRIDNGDEEYPLDLIGYKLSEENFNKNLTFSDE
ncbi:hypothetical protein RhiirA5_496063 [Rhizophagus irregularis]|uniref:DUF7431 domain-containing protein n=1 Tax=Rhizophagus irregularis TaxID=588596 RepID=A0A2N0Q373_9GLOM|nr:hypothetical protein RhiirA5_496063 [Rhizophagus irregularis]